MEPPSKSPSERGTSTGAFAALRVPGYRWVWGSVLLSSMGFMTFGMGQGWLLLQITGSPLWVGLAPGIAGIVAVLLSPMGGVLADRMDRRNLLMAGQGALAVGVLTLGALVVSGHVQIWHVMAVAVVQGAARATQPARASLTFDLVGRSGVQNAMAAQFGATSAASALGPLVGGVVLGGYGAGPLFLGIGGLGIAAVALLTRVRTPPRSYAPRNSVLANLQDGVAFSLRDRPIRGVLSLILLTEICGFSVNSMLPVVVRDVLHADGRVLGLLTSLWGLGGLTAMVGLSLGGDVRAKGWFFAGSALVMGTALLLFSLSRSLPLSLVLLMLAGGAGAIYDTMGNTLLQTLAPDAMRGRVSGVYSLLLSGGSWGSLGMGAVAEYRGVAFAIGLGGAIVAANALRMMPQAGMLSEHTHGRGKETPAPPPG